MTSAVYLLTPTADPKTVMADGFSTVVSTFIDYHDDEEMRVKVAKRRELYPVEAAVVRAPHYLGQALARSFSPVLVDTLSIWVSNLLLLHNSDDRQLPWLAAFCEDQLKIVRNELLDVAFVHQPISTDYGLRSKQGVRYNKLMFAVESMLLAMVDHVWLCTAGCRKQVK